MKQGISEYVQSVDAVFILIVAISAVILIGVTAVMIYFVFKYNRKRHPQAVNIEGNVALEITWIAIPVVLVLTMFYFGFSTFKELRIIPENAYTIKVTGQMWKWSFTYQNGKRSDTLYVPVNRPLKLVLSSLDVNHSFYIPSFRIKEDLVFGKETYLAFIPDKIGSYEITCAEYCGLNHSYMYNKINVIPQDKFEEWVARK
jgi:cytochrome c oxidase subunit 2